ncbi:lipopolysaccharide heptosyltransferase II [soil metagenome]
MPEPTHTPPSADPDAPGAINAPRRARVLVFLPTWLGDTVMATPALRLLRETMPGAVIVGLVRAGMDDLLAGSDLLDDVVRAEGRSVTGPAKTAARLVPLRLDAALILPNSFSSAAAVRLAAIPIRVGYDRDGRKLLLTERLAPPRRPPPHSGWAPVSAVEYYLGAARHLLLTLHARGYAVDLDPRFDGSTPLTWTPMLELSITPRQDAHALDILRAGGLLAPASAAIDPFALLNPGGNNPAKRWPIERFAAVAHHLIAERRMKVALNGSPAEAELIDSIRSALLLQHPEDEHMVVSLPALGGTIGSLKGIVRRARLVITNDTGPRHLAAAFNIPCVTLFGPTDPRWTTLPEHDPLHPRELLLIADSTLPEDEIADDHPQRCRIDRIEIPAVLAAVETLLDRA